MERARAELEQGGVVSLMLGRGGEMLARAAARLLGLSMPVLADPARDVYRRYGFDMALLVVQRSGVVLIDRRGIIRLVHRTTDPSEALPLDVVRSRLAASPAL